MKSKKELHQLIKNQEVFIHQSIQQEYTSTANNTNTLPPMIHQAIIQKAELINELNTNAKIAELTAYEVDLNAKTINSFLRLEGITHGAVIYHFIKKDSFFRDISSKIAYGSYKTLNMNMDFLKLIQQKFKEKGY